MSLIATYVAGNVAQITLDSARNCNAMSQALARELRQALCSAAGSQNVDIVLLKGAGRMFSAGADVREMADAQDKAAFFAELANSMYESFFVMRESSQIFIAAVHHAVIGVALPLALCCDLVWLAEGTRLVPGYLNLGLFPDGGLTYLLPEALGSKQALELLLVDNSIPAATALERGLVSAVLPCATFDAETARRAAQIAAGPIRQYRKTKELMGLRTNAHFREHLALEKRALLDSCRDSEFAERLRGVMKAKSEGKVEI